MIEQTQNQADRMTPVASAGLLNECRAAYDRWAGLASSRAGLLLMFGWAVCEAIFWPIIPDFLLVPMQIVNKRRPYLLTIAAIAGAALGGTVLYLVAFVVPGAMLTFVSHLPLVSGQQMLEVHTRLAASGVSGYFAQPWSGIPFKVWGVVGGAVGISPWQAIPAFIVARSIRMCIFSAAARLLGMWLRPFLRDYSLFVALIYAVLFFLGWWQVSG
jgi:1-acyl-sn-glycerol-3-phosphate acyltransferase